MTTPAVGTPRIAPGTRRDVGLLAWGVSRAAGAVAGTGPPNLFLTLGRHRRLFRGWMHFAGRLMPGGRLPRRETELAILRVAHLRACRYELEHHRRLARRAGLRPEELARVAGGPAAPGWTGRERVVLETVDALDSAADLDDSQWVALRAHVDEREAIELCTLVAHYEMLATIIAALRIEPDEPAPRRRHRRPPSGGTRA